MQAHIDKINEMASVMRKAIEVDEGRTCEDEERIKQLEVKENDIPCSTCASSDTQDPCCPSWRVFTTRHTLIDICWFWLTNME